MAQQRHLAWPTYMVAFALCVIPPFDSLMQVLPLRAQDPRWRFGFFGLMSNALMIPLVGLLIAFVAAGAFEHRRFQRVLGIIAASIGVLTLGMLALFALDALQVRPQVKPAAQLAFNVATLTAVLKSLLGAATLGAFSLTAFRAPKLRRQSGAAGPNTIVVSNAGTSTPRAPRIDAIPIHGTVAKVGGEA